MCIHLVLLDACQIPAEAQTDLTTLPVLQEKYRYAKHTTVRTTKHTFRFKNILEYFTGCVILAETGSKAGLHEELILLFVEVSAK